jgi:hypothetical protein
MYALRSIGWIEKGERKRENEFKKKGDFLHFPDKESPPKQESIMLEISPPEWAEKFSNREEFHENCSSL